MMAAEAQSHGAEKIFKERICSAPLCLCGILIARDTRRRIRDHGSGADKA